MRLRGILSGSLAAGCWAVVAVAAAPNGAPAPAAAVPAITPQAAEFFETRVRPVLAESCYSCHGPKVQQAGLRVDSLAGLLKGTDSGKPALVPGSPEKSPLVQAILHTGAVKMPPQGKLPPASIEALTTWVKMGAPWPSSGAGGQGPGATVQAPARDPKTWWSFQPVRKPAVPAVKNARWVKSPVDAFVLAKLEAKGLAPAPPADRRTLIRRATFDLTGLPPTQEEIDAFVSDRSPTAFAAVVDRLLASPRYGERWGRYWLDIARYADTKGYVFQEERRYPFAYTYRDWTIRAFNDDLPYDQFLVQQIAADHLQLGEDKRPLAAMGFLTLGRRFLNNQADIIDDRIDTLMRGTQGLTVACARCHDHKFDPIPQADYYSLYGVFASSTEPSDSPLIGVPENSEAYKAYERQMKVLQEEADRFLDSKLSEKLTQARAQVADYLVAARDATKGGGDLGALARQRDLNAMLLQRWQGYLSETRKGVHPVFGPWNAFAALSDAEFAAKAPALAQKFAANGDAQHRLNPLVAQAFAGKAPDSLREVARRYALLLTGADRHWREAQEAAARQVAQGAQGAAPAALPNADEEQLRQVLYGPNTPANVPRELAERLFNRADQNQYRTLRQKIDRLRATSPGAPARAMALVDAPAPYNPYIFKRGNPANRGEEVPRQFLAVLAGPQRKPFQKGSGRLELAQAIASKDNPLTARVMVNRVWLGHFGAGLVRTPSDFGLRSEPPVHQELLDFLSSRFMVEGWSVKALHRLVMLSSTYQQSSDAGPGATGGTQHAARSTQQPTDPHAIDPDNTLLWRMNRRRLDFEALRDSLLTVAGRLDATLGGAPVDITTVPFTGRRTVYGFIDRQNLPGLFRVFDFASPDTSSPQRFSTTVPQQALFLMNSPFVVEQARLVAARPEVTAQDGAARIQQLYRVVFSRAATPDEVELGLRYIQAAQAAGTSAVVEKAPVWQYGYGEFDEGAGKLKGFTPLPHFTGASWQGSAQLPDPKTGWAVLNAAGGHAGSDPQHATVRRWIAPRDGVVSIAGALSHATAQGDGVRGRIVSSRKGVLGAWNVHNGQVGTAVDRVDVKQGDTLDFVVDCLANPSFDSFNWAPIIRTVVHPDSAQAPGASVEWNAATGFSGPQPSAKPFSAWEKYAQVLLMSNEFVFVD